MDVEAFSRGYTVIVLGSSLKCGEEMTEDRDRAEVEDKEKVESRRSRGRSKGGLKADCGRGSGGDDKGKE